MDEFARPKLLLSFVADNSASMQGGKMAELMAAFRAFAAEQAEKDNVELELILFDTLSPRAVKCFDAPVIGSVAAGKLPLLGRAIGFAGARLFERVRMYEGQGVPLYRPWLFILSDGMTLDAPDEAVERLEAAEREEKLLYMPFKLSPKLLSPRLQVLDRTKHMIEITPGHIASFFEFVKEMIARREETEPGAPMKFNKSDFEGWAVL